MESVSLLSGTVSLPDTLSPSVPLETSVELSTQSKIKQL